MHIGINYFMMTVHNSEKWNVSLCKCVYVPVLRFVGLMSDSFSVQLNVRFSPVQMFLRCATVPLSATHPPIESASNLRSFEHNKKTKLRSLKYTTVPYHCHCHPTHTTLLLHANRFRSPTPHREHSPKHKTKDSISSMSLLVGFER